MFTDYRTVCQGDSSCVSLYTRPSVSGVAIGAWHRPDHYTSHARLYFNRGSSETLCCVKAEGLEPASGNYISHEIRNSWIRPCTLSARNFRP